MGFDMPFTDPGLVLLPPCDRNAVPNTLTEKILAYLATRFALKTKNIRPHLRTVSVHQFGKVRRLDGGEVMNASTLVAVGDDRRDATFIRVSCILFDLCYHSTDNSCL